MAYEDFLEWATGDENYFESKDFVNKEQVDKEIDSLISKAKNKAKTAQQSSGLNRLRDKWVEQKTDKATDWWNRIETALDANVQREVQSFKTSVNSEEIENNDRPTYNHELSQTVKEELEQHREEVGLAKINKSLGRIEKEKSLRQLESKIGLSGLTLDAETRQAIQQKREQLIAEPQRIITDIRREIQQATTIEELLATDEKFEQNRELITEQPKSGIIIRDIETRLQIKQEMLSEEEE